MNDPMRQMLSDRGMTRVIMLCLTALALNAVLIQTVVSDESALKTGTRVCVLVLAAFGVAIHAARMSVGIMLLILYSFILLVARQNTDQLSYIFVFVLCFALFTVKERSLDKAVVFASLASLGLVFAFLAAGITQNEVLDLRGRNTFGTNGVPFFFNLVYGAFGMLIFYFYKYKIRGRLLVMAGSVTIGTHLFTLTDARGGYYSLLGFVALIFLVPTLSKLGLFRFIAALLPILCLGLAFYMASLWDDGEANALLSGRPILFQRFLDELTLDDVVLSTSVKAFNKSDTIVDNSYLHLIIGGGAVVSLVFFVVFAQAISNLFKAKRHVDVAFLIATCLYFNSESILLRIENLFVIYFWYMIFRHCNPVFTQREAPAFETLPVPVPEMAQRTKAAKVLVPDWQRMQIAGSTSQRVPDWVKNQTAGGARRGHVPDWARPGKRH